MIGVLPQTSRGLQSFLLLSLEKIIKINIIGDIRIDIKI
jgi:hypothetical protein